ncbi:hypothetical protein L2E82_23034 [Cichorium intybus]|uniref:Uncharacterized protein n=1 Tax=Cichorium intybus TaxID=13427 RepID=A0ACB9DZQ4_CICIN|nr:hypothetical protein L2E82_23034 [Cichorium intybus]
MKLGFPSPSLLRRPLSSLFSASITTEINSPPRPLSSSPSLSLSPPLEYLQSVLSEIKLLFKTPQSYSSLTTLDSLLAKTHLLDSATSLILIDYLSQIKKLGRSKTIISHLKSRGRVSDSFLYSLVFDILVKDGRISDVDNVWGEICGSVKSFNFSNYVISVCRTGGVDEIKDIYERILMDAASILDKQTYVALSAALCNVNEGFLAKNLVKQMYDKGMTVDNWTYFLIFQCFCRNGNLEEADLALRKLVINGFSIDISIYGSFLHGLCKRGKHREANKLFRKLTKVGPPKERGLVLKEGRRVIFQLNCEGVVPKMMAYESYFRALCNVGKLNEAEILLKKMMSGTTLPEICVYGSFIKALFRAGRDEDAMKFFNVQKKKKLVRVNEIGRYVIMGLCDKGRVDDALLIFEEIGRMVNGGYLTVTSTLLMWNDLLACNSILKCYWKQSRVADAEVFFERWRLHGKIKVETCIIMINGYCSHNDVSKALVVFEEMLKSKMVVSGALYERLIIGLCDHGRANEAFKYLNVMIENGHMIFYKRWRSLFRSILT